MAACTKPATGCGANEYCASPQGMCSAAGSCQPIPGPSAICPDVIVCGCDGVMYPTPCDAARARVSIANVGSCTF